MSWRTRWPVRPMPFTACSTRSGRRRSNAPRASWPRWTRFCRRTSPVPPSNRGTGGITPRSCVSRTMPSTRRCCVPTSRSRTCRAASSTWPTASTASPSSRSSCRYTIPMQSPTRCSTPTARTWACSISTISPATARARAPGAATMSSRPIRTASAWRPW